MLTVWKKSWEPFGSCLLNSTANPAHFHPSLAGLAVPFSRQLPNGSHDFFQTFSICFLIVSLRTHKPQSPFHFWHIIFQLLVVCVACLVLNFTTAIMIKTNLEYLQPFGKCRLSKNSTRSKQNMLQTNLWYKSWDWIKATSDVYKQT